MTHAADTTSDTITPVLAAALARARRKRPDSKKRADNYVAERRRAGARAGNRAPVAILPSRCCIGVTGPLSNPMSNPPLWKASVTLAKEIAADACAVLELAPPGPQAVLIAEEPFAPQATVEALYAEEPDAALLSRIVGHAVTVEPLPDQDWIRLSQEGLPPVRAGRFFVYGAHDAGQVPPGVIPVKIEAGLAFGTGHHETTALCLAALSDLAKARRYADVLDLGCGTGLLAIGAAKLWRRPLTASDVDPVAVETAIANARANGVGPLVRAATADGLAAPALAAHAPYDLILANILAGPLTRLAPSICAALARGGTLVLSGLLVWQENLVASFYRPHGLILRARRRIGPWSALVLEKPRA